MSGTPNPLGPTPTPEKPALTSGGQGAGAAGLPAAGGAPKIKVRYYRGHNDIVTFYLPNGEKVKIYYVDQKWLEPVVEFIKKVGRHRVEKRWGYSSVLHARVQYKDDVWVAEVDADELIKLITTSKSWERSEKARKIVEYLEELVGG
jgi:hypothetical protein